MRNQHEHKLQCSLVKWFRLAYPKLAPLLFAVPNGENRNPITGARLKAAGVRAGVADLLFLYNGRCFAFEIKATKGKPSEAQKEWASAVRDQHICYNVIRDFEEFRVIIEYVINSKR